MKCSAMILAVMALMVSVASAELVVLQDGRDGYTGAQDTMILTLESNKYGTHANGVYQTHYIDYGGVEYRSLFSWDVSAHSGRTVAGNATITLTRDGQHPTQNNSVDFYGVTEIWTEGGANSSTRDGTIAWAGGDLLGTPGASASMTALLDSTGLTAGNTASTLTIPAATVTDWLTSGFASVIGIMPGTTNSNWAWHSKDSTGQGTLQDQKPKLTLDLVGGTPSTDFTWNSSGTGAWTTEQNWLPLGGPPGSPSAPSPNDHSVTFAGAISVPTTVVVDTDQTIHAITFDNTASYVIAGAASVNLIDDSLGASPSVSVVQGNHEFQADVTLLNDTQVTVGTGALLEFNNLLNLGTNTLTKIGDGELAINNILNMDSGGGIVCAAGTCSGSGTIGGNLINSGGTLSPGNSPGALTVAGNYTQTVGSTLDIEIGGLLDGEYDVLDISGTAILDGILDISLLSFAPSPNDSFAVLVADLGITDNGIALAGDMANDFSMSLGNGGTELILTFQATGPAGDFDLNGTVDGADFLLWQRDQNVGDLADWEANYGATSAVSSVAAVPEPVSASLLVMALGTLALVSRRQSIKVNHKRGERR